MRMYGVKKVWLQPFNVITLEPSIFDPINQMRTITDDVCVVFVNKGNFEMWSHKSADNINRDYTNRLSLYLLYISKNNPIKVFRY